MGEIRTKWVLLLLVCFGINSCGGTSHTPKFHKDSNPELLSQWDLLFVDNNRLNLSSRVLPYDLNSALFSDYAHKLRTVWVPQGSHAQYSGTDAFEFPVGSIISKTFYYPISEGNSTSVQTVLRRDDTTNQHLLDGFDLNAIKLIETRLLVRREDGWTALPYVWNAEQTDAVLRRVGDVQQLTLSGPNLQDQPFTYIVPNQNQCAGCHATNATTREIKPIGLKTRHLNKSFNYASGPENQLVAWARHGFLSDIIDPDTAPRNAQWDNLNHSIEDRARAYLDINCSHCHNESGPADTSGLHLEASSPSGAHLGTCKLPIAAGTGTGNRKYDIVPGHPDQSIFVYRMASTNPAEMMPELGRATAHSEGVQLISHWITDMDGACD